MLPDGARNRPGRPPRFSFSAHKWGDPKEQEEPDTVKKYIMALDQGTTSSRCILFTPYGEAVSCAQREFPQIFPREGWVEHRLLLSWTSSS